MTTTGSFNLIDEPWIPVLRLNGQTERVGIRCALTEAGSIRQLAASNPMDNVALLRFLLAILYWCKGNPPAKEQQQRILTSNPFPSEWFSKLEEHREAFNLLGNGCRFFQDNAKKNDDPTHTADYLLHEVPSGRNMWHFRHATDNVDGLCPACCAIGLVRLPVFATQGGRGKSPGVNAKPPLYVLPVGNSLASTLLLSWQTTGNGPGTPAWQAPDGELPEKGVVPLLNGLTWIPRSVWLAHPEEPECICISCGRRHRLIRRCVFHGKGTSKTEGRAWRDPHVIYETAKTGKTLPLQTSNALKASDAEASDWASHLAAILRGPHSSEEANIWIVSFSTVQDKYLEVTEWCLPRIPFAEQDSGLIDTLHRWESEGHKLARRIRPKASSRKHVEFRPAIDAIRPDAESRAFQVARKLLREEASFGEALSHQYRRLMEAVASSLSPGYTTQAVARRDEIARVLPHMTPRPSAKARKPKEKKGEP